MNEYEEQYKLLRKKIQTVGNFKGQFVFGRNAMVEIGNSIENVNKQFLTVLGSDGFADFVSNCFRFSV